LVFYNILLATHTAFIGILIGKHLQIKYSILIYPFILFTPIFLRVSISGLTEITFSFLLVLSVYLFLKTKFWLGASVFSLCFFARTESIFIAPIFISYFLFKKEYLTSLWFFWSIIFMTFLGYFLGKGIFWIITEIPYLEKENAYGSGAFLHYFIEAPVFFGIPLLVLLFVYSLQLFYRIYNNLYCRLVWKELLLLFLPSLTFFFAHVFMWYLGKGGSYGLTRVMACITPLLAILSTRSLDILPLNKLKTTGVIISTLVLFSVVFYPFYIKEFPIEKTPEQKLMYETCLWLKKHKNDLSKLFYFDPYACMLLNKNPFEKASSEELGKSICSPLNDNDILIWDSQFGQEKKADLKMLMNCNYLNPLFAAHTSTHNPKGPDFNDYDIVIFEKNTLTDLSYFNSYDTIKIGSIIDDTLDLSDSYSESIDINYDVVKNYCKILFEVKGASIFNPKDYELNIVFSISDSKNNLIAYRGINIRENLTSTFDEVHTINLPQLKQKDLKVSTYIWLVDGNNKIEVEKFDVYGIKQTKH
jgi:hypothetical protein